MAGVFISYRRNDSDVAAGRLADDLSLIFGRNSIFRDVDSLEPGDDYVKALDHALDSCAAAIVVIGPHWSTITDDTGHRRLEDPKDWVRIEISRTLARGIRLIPVLISATMPREAEVPEDLKPLLRRQAQEISDRHWRQDLEVLAQALEKVSGIERCKPIRSPRTISRRSALIATVALSILTIVGLVWYFNRSPRIPAKWPGEVEDFSGVTDSWPLGAEGSDENFEKLDRRIVGGRYRWDMIFRHSHLHYSILPFYGSVLNFFAAVDVVFTGQSVNPSNAGIVFGFFKDRSDRRDKHFDLLIRSNGNWGLSYADGNENKSILGPTKADIYINRPNRIAVQVDSGIMQFYINGVPVGTWKDTDFSGGEVGLAVGAESKGPVVVEFARFELRKKPGT